MLSRILNDLPRKGADVGMCGKFSYEALPTASVLQIRFHTSDTTLEKLVTFLIVKRKMYSRILCDVFNMCL